jgi:hypothetical protein
MRYSHLDKPPGTWLFAPEGHGTTIASSPVGGNHRQAEGDEERNEHSRAEIEERHRRRVDHRAGPAPGGGRRRVDPLDGPAFGSLVGTG